MIVLLNCRAPFYPPSRKPARAKIVVIDEVPQRPHIVYQVLNADFYLEGGVAATLREMAVRAREQGLIARTADTSWHAAEIAAVAAAEDRSGDGIDPVHLVAALRSLADDAIVVDETITHSRVVQRHLQRTTPDSYFYVQGGLGQGIAVALGVKLAAPAKQVIFTVGDGAFLYNPIVQSLQAARSNGLPILIVVFNNTEYRSMKMNHLRFYPQGAAVETGEFLGNDLSDQPDLASLAEPFGMHGETVTVRDELTPALDRALKAVRNGTTAIVNVHVTR